MTSPVPPLYAEPVANIVSMWRHTLMGSMLLLCGCDNYPRDVADTGKRVAASKTIQVGLLAGPYSDHQKRLIHAYLAALRNRTGSTPVLRMDETEVLLARLEEGKLDIVIGRLADDSPWIDDVTLLDPLEKQRVGSRTLGLRPIARNGENHWIALLESVARDQGAVR